MSATPIFSVAKSGHSTHVKYKDALTHADIREEAIASLRKRKDDGIVIRQNIASVTLVFSDGSIISEVAESSSTGVRGHSERRALAKAINKAITDGKFSASLTPITNLTNPAPSEFCRFQEAMRSSTLSSIKIYTERVPCTQDDKYDGTEQCDVFFAKLFDGMKYRFYYSVPLRSKELMDSDLQQQYEEAKMVLDAQDLPEGAFDSSQEIYAGEQLGKEKGHLLQQPAKPLTQAQASMVGIAVPATPQEPVIAAAAVPVQGHEVLSAPSSNTSKRQRIGEDKGGGMASQQDKSDGIPQEKKQRQEPRKLDEEAVTAASAQSSSSPPVAASSSDIAPAVALVPVQQSAPTSTKSTWVLPMSQPSQPPITVPLHPPMLPSDPLAATTSVLGRVIPNQKENVEEVKAPTHTATVTPAKK